MPAETRISNSLRRTIRHVLGVLCSAGFLAVAPVVLYGGLIVWSRDLGGPLNFIIIPVASGIVGFGVSLTAYLPLGLLAERFNFKRWLQLVGGLSGLLTVVVVVAWILFTTMKQGSHWLGLFSAWASLCLYLVVGFFIYLCSLGVCRKIIP